MLPVVICLVGLVSGILAIDCPWPCKCTWVVDSLYANCSGRGLQKYPLFDNNIPVEHLDLSGNRFEEFPTLYADIDSLIYLDLSDNAISFLDSRSLIGFTSLRTLLMANNSIISWSDLNPNEAFKNAPSLKRLSLSRNHFGSFGSEDTHQQLKSQTLVELELANCEIYSLGGDQLVNQLPNLERLTLSNNRLIQMAALPSRSLRILDLSNCSIQELSSHFIEALPNLESLNLSRNTQLQFGTIEVDLIVSYELRYLEASFCNIDVIDLSGLPLLTEINLRGNMLRSVDAHTFENNTFLEVVNLSENVIRLVGLDAFAGLKRLKKLNLAYNEIARLDRNVIRYNDVLIELNLHRNVIEKFTRIVSNSVRVINMSWCEIISIDSSSLTSLSAIQKLDLSNNLINDIPNLMRSETLQSLSLANCRLSTIRNNTFRDFPELADLRLNGNRLTNPINPEYFRSNRYLDQLWLGDNPWICDCQSPEFVEFYEFLTVKPPKIRDKNHLRCASPSDYYGKLWDHACIDVWMASSRNSNGGKVWATIWITILVIGALICAYACMQKILRKRKRRQDHREYADNNAEARRIREINDRMLQEESTMVNPLAVQQAQEISLLPTYEDALRMPKLVRPAKSMGDLLSGETSRSRKLRRSQTQADGDGNSPSENENDNDLQLDNRQRFRSVEMLSNRDKERTARYARNQRRTGYMEYTSQSGSRRFSIEESRFPAAHLKSQNLQSAEHIGNFQSYENSPYSKRKPKIAEIPPFKRINLITNSVEFLTDTEYEDVTSGGGGSPFAKRKPKTPVSMPTQVTTAQVYNSKNLDPAVEDYFGSQKLPKGAIASSSSTIASEFQELDEPELKSLPDDNRSNISTSDADQDVERGKRKKRKNSASRRVSGSFATASGSLSSSDAETQVHKPMRETLF